MPVLLIGTLDTKGSEVAFVRDLLAEAGVAVLVVDAGVLGPPIIAADVPRERVFAAAGTSLAAVRQAGDRGQAVEAAARGASPLARQLQAAGQEDCVLGRGGSDQHPHGIPPMRALPRSLPNAIGHSPCRG